MNNNNIDIIAKGSSVIEGALEIILDAQGKGLGEKLSSVENHIPQKIVKLIKELVQIRNKNVHEPYSATPVDDSRIRSLVGEILKGIVFSEAPPQPENPLPFARSEEVAAIGDDF